jgi:chitodextrinase
MISFLSNAIQKGKCLSSRLMLIVLVLALTCIAGQCPFCDDENQPPVAVINCPVVEVPIHQPLTFDGFQSYDPDGSIVSHMWNFGDGHTASGISVQYLYSTPGNYTVVLTVTDDAGSTATDSKTLTIFNNPPVAIITGPNKAKVNQSVEFNGFDSYDPDGDVLCFYWWDLGDGVTANGPLVNHTYMSACTYIVTLEVSDPFGGSDTATKEITVYPPD